MVLRKAALGETPSATGETPVLPIPDGIRAIVKEVKCAQSKRLPQSAGLGLGEEVLAVEWRIDSMSLFAIGDIHGCRKALEALIAAVNPGEEDELVFLGDYVNRGRDSRGVIEFLIGLAQRRRCVFLRGNHEVMMLGARGDREMERSWRFCGGSETLRSYNYWGEDFWWDFIPKAHWDFLEGTRRFLETERHIFAHGCVEANLHMAEQPDAVLFWERFDQIRPHRSGKKIICGHTPDLDGEVQDVGFATCIDTGAVFGGWLTALEVDSGLLRQANEPQGKGTGMTRTGRLKLKEAG